MGVIGPLQFLEDWAVGGNRFDPEAVVS